MTASSGGGLWAHVVASMFFATALSTVACQHREALSTGTTSTATTSAQAVASKGEGRWQGCEVLGPGNEASPPAMIITCEDGRRLSRIEVARGQFTEQAYRDNVDRFIDKALGFHVRPESTTLSLPEGREARVERLVTRVADSLPEGGESTPTDTALSMAGVFLPGDSGSFMTCSHPLDGPRGEHDFDGCDADIRELFVNPPWPGAIPDRG